MAVRTPMTISWSSENLTQGENGDLILTDTEHVLQFDAVISDQATFGSTITEQPVARGAAISDHKIPNNDALTFEAIVSNTPIASPPPSGSGRIQGPDGSPQKTAAGATALVFSQAFDRVSDVAFTLRRLAREAISVTIQTRYRTFTDMQIENVSTQSVEGDALTFLVDAKEVRTVEVDLVDAPAPREPRARPTEDHGAQETEGTEGTGASQSRLAASTDAVRNGEGAQGVLNALGLGGS